MPLPTTKVPGSSDPDILGPGMVASLPVTARELCYGTGLGAAFWAFIQNNRRGPVGLLLSAFGLVGSARVLGTHTALQRPEPLRPKPAQPTHATRHVPHRLPLAPQMLLWSIA